MFEVVALLLVFLFVSGCSHLLVFGIGWLLGRNHDRVLSFLRESYKRYVLAGKVFRVSSKKFEEELATQLLPWGMEDCSNCGHFGTQFEHAGVWHIWSVRGARRLSETDRCCSASKSALGACQRLIAGPPGSRLYVISVHDAAIMRDMQALVHEPWFKDWCKSCHTCTGFLNGEADRVCADVHGWADHLQEVVLDRCNMARATTVREVRHLTLLQRLALRLECDLLLATLL